MVFILLLVGGLVLFFIIRAVVRAPGGLLRQKFVGFGTLKGHSEADIVAIVGNPQARSTVPGGNVLQWQATGYRIALGFDPNGICTGVTHEFRAR